MSFEKTIQELNKIRNEEYEQLRYDRSVWEGNYQGSNCSMINVARQDVRTPEELSSLEQTKRMIDFYGKDLSDRLNEATEDELQELMNLYDKELSEHQEATTKAITKHQSNLQALETELKRVLDKHSTKIKDSLKTLAELQRDEVYLYDSKGIPTPYSNTGILDYDKRAGHSISSDDRCLSKSKSPNYLALHHNYSALEQELLTNLAKAGE